MTRARFAVETRRGLFRRDPEQLLISAEEIDPRMVEEHRCPLRDALNQAFDAYAAKSREEARAWASVKASANLPAVVKGDRRRAAAEQAFKARAAA